MSKADTQINLIWTANPETDTVGYNVYWGTNSGHPYTNILDVGNVNSYTITGLTPGDYYVTIASYDNDYNPANDEPETIVNENQTNGNESWYAVENVITVGDQADVSASPISHDFGNIVVDSSSTQELFTLSNIGTLDLVIGTISITGTDATEFGIQNNLCSGQTLSTDASCTLEAVFSPTILGSKSAEISIPSNDPDTPTLELPLSGIGIYDNTNPTVTIDFPGDGTTPDLIYSVTGSVSDPSPSSGLDRVEIKVYDQGLILYLGPDYLWYESEQWLTPTGRHGHIMLAV